MCFGQLVNMKRMGGSRFNNGSRLKASSLSFSIVTFSFTLLLLVVNMKFSHCFKTMKTVHKLADDNIKVSSGTANPVSHNKVSLLWSRQHSAIKPLSTTAATKSPPTIVAAAAESDDSSGACHHSSSSSKTLSKCRKVNLKRPTAHKIVNEFSDKSKNVDVVKQKKRTASKSGSVKSSANSSNNSNSKNSDYKNVNLVTPPQVPKSFKNLSKLTPDTIVEINKFVRKKRHYCKLHSFVGFSCQKLKLSMWLAKQMEKNVTKLNSWLEIVRNNETSSSSSSSKDLRNVQAEYWPEKAVYRLIKAWGDPEDIFVFYKYKDFVNSRELKISLPYQVEVKVSPKSAKEFEQEEARTLSLATTQQETARWFWDPGFNLKLKLPFFRDELKVAVSTGPSFVAGIGVGIAVLIIKSLFAPFLFGLKWMLYNVFFKESSPFELMKMLFLSHAPSEPWESAVPPPSIENYRPPPMHNHFDNRPPPMHGSFENRPPPMHGSYERPPFRGPPPGRAHRPPRPPPHMHPHHPPPFHSPFNHGLKGYGPPPPPHYGSPEVHGPSPYDMEYSPPPYDLKHQFTQPTPMISTLGGVNPTMSQLEQLYRAQLLEEGLGLRRPTSFQSLVEPDPTNSLDMAGTDGPGMESMNNGMEADPQDNQAYIPSTGLQAEVEHFDPFYSPLLSKIDSIFTHLGHSDEGCRERVVCSIYKFPVKYAPYSNLLSAQLSKHQSELKRPVSSSPKILRYFRYMKAAKDGQGGDNCVELYPKCDSDTDSVSSLPMITTFHQLSELMTAEGSSPGVALASAG